LSSPERAGGGRAAVDLVVIGDANPDVLVIGDDVTPEFGQKEKLVRSGILTVGGSAAITAVAAARLGLSVALVAAVGPDAAGEFMRGELARAGVDTSWLAVRAAAPTGLTVVLTGGTDRAILTAAGAIGSLTPSDVPGELLAGARHVHVSSYFLMAGSLGPGLAGLLAGARAAGATTSVDTNWDPSGRWGADTWLRAALAQADLLLPNEAEALALSGQPDLAGAVRALAGRADDAGGSAGAGGTARVVVKLGARGALCADRDGWRQVSLPPVTPVDDTGAGDCFNAGLITGLLNGLDLPGAAALGCAAGALSTQAAGGTGSCLSLVTASALAAKATTSKVTASEVIAPEATAPAADETTG
jgi:sugar/nucleoside kinase (ribokinase family)